MNEKKVFCEECRKDVVFNVCEKQLEGSIKGVKYKYKGKEAYCNECNSEIYVPEINDYNLEKLYDVYREKNNIISLKMVLEIPKKYKIGKRPLSMLLDWGELTFSRYCEGDVPTKQYSEILKKIYENPHYYKEILEKNKQKIKDITYKKSKIEVEKLIGKTENLKIQKVIEYLLSKCEDITPLSLQKALYYIQGFHYSFYGKFIFLEECEAWVHGPVYRGIYFKYRDYKFDPIKSNQKFDKTVFSSLEKAIFDSIIKNVCCYSGKTLESFTHSETPWLMTRGDLNELELSDRIIKKEDIGNYFIEVKNNYNMVNPADIKNYTKDMFEKI